MVSNVFQVFSLSTRLKDCVILQNKYSEGLISSALAMFKFEMPVGQQCENYNKADDYGS